MVEVKKYHFKPTALIPNSPQPLLYYPDLLNTKTERHPAEVHKRLDTNGWGTQWIYRYGPTQSAHYHSSIHECMVVLSGTATIRFGVGDTSDDLEASTFGGAKEDGGIEIEAKAGDVFVIPAGVAHKTHKTSPSAPFALLTPGKGRGVDAEDPIDTLSKIKLDGFCMIGAFPKNCGTWDFTTGGEDQGSFERTWSVAKPEKDPVLGDSVEGTCGIWNDVPRWKR